MEKVRISFDPVVKRMIVEDRRAQNQEQVPRVRLFIDTQDSRLLANRKIL